MATLSKPLINKLYFKNKLSTIEIARKLGISEWVVLSFMRRNNMPRRTFFEANRIAFDKKKPTFLVKNRLSIFDEKLKMAGVLLYWGEGAKLRGKNAGIDFANSNPEMIAVFLNFLRKICRVNEQKLRVYLYCYSNQDIESLLKYWYKITNIPLSQFSKPYVRSNFSLEKIGRMKYGMIHVRYADKKLLFLMDTWIKEYSKNLVG
jgi:hypothetical protein